MKKSIFAAILTTGILVGCTTPAANQGPKQFEYTSEFINDVTFTSEMNALGLDGWQVVGSRRAKSSSTDAYGYEFVFMREVPAIK